MKKPFLIFAVLLLFIAENTLTAQTNTKEVSKSKSSKKTAATPAQSAPVKAGEIKSTPPANSGAGENKSKVTVQPTEVTPLETPSKETPSKGGTAVLQTPANVNADFNILDKYSKPVVEEKTNGKINWTQQYVEARGQAVIDTVRFKNKAQAKAMAIRGATVVAQRNLLEMVKGVNVVGETTVQDMITMNDYVYTRVEGVVKGAQQVGGTREIDGMVEVTLRMPIYGETGIAGTFGDNELVMARKKMGLVEASAMIEEMAAGEEVIDGSKPFVFNIRGKEIDPSMFPVVVDEKGNVKLDFSKWYDAKNGKFPQYMQLGKEVMQDIGFQKGVDVIDLVQNSNGQFTIPQDSKKKVIWQKIGNVAQKIGKVLFSIL
jgi:hypothetical protein